MFSTMSPLLCPLQYYDIPSVSLRGAAYHLMRRGVGNFKVRVSLTLRVRVHMCVVKLHDQMSFECLYYYATPTLQVDKVIIPSNHVGRVAAEPGVAGESFYVDGVHPTDFGHHALADMLFELTWQGVVKVTRDRDMVQENGSREAAAARVEAEEVEPGDHEEGAEEDRDVGLRRLLAARPGGTKQQQQQQQQQQLQGEEDLPPPMVPGTVDVSASTCFMQVG
jgi:hypothetical protein